MGRSSVLALPSRARACNVARDAASPLTTNTAYVHTALHQSNKTVQVDYMTSTMDYATREVQFVNIEYQVGVNEG